MSKQNGKIRVKRANSSGFRTLSKEIFLPNRALVRMTDGQVRDFFSLDAMPTKAYPHSSSLIPYIVQTNELCNEKSHVSPHIKCYPTLDTF